MEALYRDLSEEEKVSLRSQIKTSTLSRKLKEVILDLIRNTETKRVDYEKASWAYLQADQNGERRAYEKILKLLDHKET